MCHVVVASKTVLDLRTAFEKTENAMTSYNFKTNNYESYDKTVLKPVNLTIGLLGLATMITTYLIYRKRKSFIKDSISIHNE